MGGHRRPASPFPAARGAVRAVPATHPASGQSAWDGGSQVVTKLHRKSPSVTERHRASPRRPCLTSTFASAQRLSSANRARSTGVGRAVSVAVRLADPQPASDCLVPLEGRRAGDDAASRTARASSARTGTRTMAMRSQGDRATLEFLDDVDVQHRAAAHLHQRRHRRLSSVDRQSGGHAAVEDAHDLVRARRLGGDEGGGATAPGGVDVESASR
jgi:hypothetical protein